MNINRVAPGVSDRLKYRTAVLVWLYELDADWISTANT